MNRLAALLTIAVLPFAAWAADPPGRAARLSLIEGEAAVFVDREQGWEGARVNLTLTSENSVWTEPGSRAEVRFGAKALRLGETTQFDIPRLDDAAFQGHVARGALAVRIFEFDRNETFLVTTPEARFQLRGNGRYRIEADPDRGESRLTVFSGTARLEVEGGTISVDTGRGIRVMGGDRPRYEFEAAYSTELDDWALARDQRWEEREAARYVPREMTGWEDLDDYGVWRNEPEYGAVWFPTRVEVGWAPYRYGRWTWVRPWGWTWVDDAPWGYAPFHYGRWVSVGNRWGWYPGRHTSRPVWAPALVGWVGGAGWSISVSPNPTNVVGWYPLSPYDNYQPWYTTNVTYVTHVNRIVLPYRGDRDRRRDGRRDDRYDYRHDNRDRGSTVVPRNQFGGRRPVQSVSAPVAREVVAAQPVVSGSSVLPTQNEWRQRVRPGNGSAAAAPWAPSGNQSATSPRPAAPLITLTPGKPPIAGAPAAPQGRPDNYGRPAPAEPAVRVRPNDNRGADPRAPRSVERVVPSQPAPVAKPVAPAVQKPTGGVQRPAPHQEKPVARQAAPSAPSAPPAQRVAPSQEKPAADKPSAPTDEKPSSGGGQPASREKPGRGG